MYIDNGALIGANLKVQDFELICWPARLESGVFLSSGVILTNDHYLRSLNSDVLQKAASNWGPVGVIIRQGASIGAGSICIAPVDIGALAPVAAESTVTKDVPSFDLVAGVPAKKIRWVGKGGDAFK